MIIYDEIRADQIVDGDQVFLYGDPLENVSRSDETSSAVTVVGYSHNTGDMATYVLSPDFMVELWTV